MSHCPVLKIEDLTRSFIIAREPAPSPRNRRPRCVKRPSWGYISNIPRGDQESARSRSGPLNNGLKIDCFLPLLGLHSKWNVSAGNNTQQWESKRAGKYELSTWALMVNFPGNFKAARACPVASFDYLFDRGSFDLTWRWYSNDIQIFQVASKLAYNHGSAWIS